MKHGSNTDKEKGSRRGAGAAVKSLKEILDIDYQIRFAEVRLIDRRLHLEIEN